MRTRWLAAAGGATLAAVLGIVLVVQMGGGPACAAPPTGSTVHSGKATFYELGSGGGNCSYVGPPADGLFVALSPGEYSAAAACGGYLDVTGPRGKVRVKIVDQCPECETGHIDLSKKAFARVADPVRGIVSVKYKAVVNPAVPGPLSFRIKEGASQYWFAVLVIDHGNPLSKVEARSGSGAFHALSRTDYNYYLAEGGLGSGPYSIRVTDVYGQRATASGITMAPAKIQRTSTVVYGAGARPATQPKSTNKTSRPPVTHSPSPSPAVSTVPPETEAPVAAASAPVVRAAACSG